MHTHIGKKVVLVESTKEGLWHDSMTQRLQIRLHSLRESKRRRETQWRNTREGIKSTKYTQMCAKNKIAFTHECQWRRRHDWDFKDKIETKEIHYQFFILIECSWDFFCLSSFCVEKRQPQNMKSLSFFVRDPLSMPLETLTLLFLKQRESLHASLDSLMSCW